MIVEINQKKPEGLKRPGEMISGEMSIHRQEGKILEVRKTTEFVFCFSLAHQSGMKASNVT